MNKETDQLMEIEKLRKKLEDTEKAMAKLIAEMNSDQYEAKVRDFGKRFPLLTIISICYINFLLFFFVSNFVFVYTYILHIATQQQQPQQQN